MENLTNCGQTAQSLMQSSRKSKRVGARNQLLGVRRLVGALASGGLGAALWPWGQL